MDNESSVFIPSHALKIFMKHAKLDPDTGEYFLGTNEFVDAVAPPDEDFRKITRSQYAILFKVADRTNKGRVSLQDWTIFDNLLSKPDADYEVAFRVFDLDGNGVVSFDEFTRLYNQTKSGQCLPFDWSADWVSLYLGQRKSRHDMTYLQFTQMLRGFQGERVRQAFLHFDKHGKGYIEPEEFQRIILETARHKLSDHVLTNLQTLCNIAPRNKISYAYVRAFQNVVRELDLLDFIIRRAIAKNPTHSITRTEFLNEAARVSRFSFITPLEADILFHFAGLGQSSDRLELSDFSKVLDASWQARSPYSADEAAAMLKGDNFNSQNHGIIPQVLESLYHFGLGSIAGAFGAFMVYPIDLVKTRMQNQRNVRVGEVLYKNSLDCARKVFANEGFRGFYSGVVPQLVGVAPEKAIKLTVNDFVRNKLTDPETGSIRPIYEIIAGGSAGACQVIFTNPLEIVKIRLQVQGELSTSVNNVPRRSALWFVRNLGLFGLYKGASACLLRDVPFSAIYFPSYNHLKKDVFGESPTHPLSVTQLLLSGAIAGMPAAYLTTPCDVIKTRLQVEARKGEQTYTTLRNCAKTIWQQEGFRAFFKGGPARILRSSPQFGFTLAGYEVLQKLIPSPGSTSKLSQMSVNQPADLIDDPVAPLFYLKCRNALKILLDLDSNFARFSNPFQPTSAPNKP